MRLHNTRILAIAFGLALLLPNATLAHTSRATYDWHLGDALLQSFGFPVGEEIDPFLRLGCRAA